ncbi:MAG: efflux RND transporter periplasmic adaptor subunit, partial [Idiomarina sp.]|nr:efflux RND transporter periplasmic adaptor subunit [Idiomarina sp.]
MFNRFWPVSILLALTLAACGGDPEQGEQQEMPPSPVTVESVDTTDVKYYGEYAARVRGAREVEVSAQVSGILKERRFEEGSAVEEGQTLFLIDPELYEIQLATARADMSDAESAARRAQSEWQRVSGLYEQNALSTRDYENAQSERDAAQARVARARAAVQDAERNLRYTRVESPINGIAGIEQLTEGNLVQSGMVLTHVTQVDPIHVHFSMPEADAWRQRVARQNDSDAANQVWAIMPDGSEYAEVGSINYIDPRVSERSASVTMRGRFDNADGELIPGQYIRVRVLVAEYRNVVLIDPSAVGEGRESAQVFVLNDDGETV